MDGVEGTLVMTGMFGGVVSLIGTIRLTLGRRGERIETWHGAL